MQPIERGGYSREEILAVLHGRDSARNVRFRYDLLDKDEYYKKTLETVESGEVSMSAFSTIKRTAKFRVKERIAPESKSTGSESFSDMFTTGNRRWDEGTHNQTVVDPNTGAMRLTTPAITMLPDPDFQTVGATKGLSNEWKAYDPSNSATGISFAQGSSSGWGGSWGQQMIRLKSGSMGMQTIAATQLSLNSGDTVYVGFMYKSSSSDIIPSYTYAMSTAGNMQFYNYTVTDVGGGWKLFQGQLTVPTARTVGLLIGWSNGTSGNVWIDEIYFQKNTPPTYSGEWTSPIIKMFDYKAGTITNSSVAYGWEQATQADSQVLVYSRVSTNGGSSWSSWSQQTSGSQISGLTIGTQTTDEVLVQFRVVLKRYRIHGLAVVFNSLYIDAERDYEVIIPEGTEINYLQDRIQPFMEIKMPKGDWIEFPLGVFLLSSPTRMDGVNGSVYREIEAYDGLIILDEDKFTNRYLVPDGKDYTEAVKEILESAGVTKYAIEDSIKFVTRDIEFKTGTSKLEAVNQLLSAINYTPLWVNANGYFVSSPYVSPTDRAYDYTYEDNELSVTYSGMEEELDIFSVPNVWVVTESNPEKQPLVSVVENNNPRSQTSIEALGRRIVDFREIDEIADQATLNAYTERIAFEASQVFGKLKFKTALMPFHEYSDVLYVRYAPLKVNHKFAETAWTMPLEAGAQMEHEVRRVVDI
jgi:hypothetical protein